MFRTAQEIRDYLNKFGDQLSAEVRRDLENRLIQMQEEFSKAEQEKKSAEEARRAEELKKKPLQEQIESMNHTISSRIEETNRMWQNRFDMEARNRRAAELTAYREVALRNAGPEIIPEMVGGGSEQEIDASISKSKNEYARLRREFEQSYAQQQGSRQESSVSRPATVTNMAPISGGVAAPIPPPSVYGQTGAAPPPGVGGGFPSTPNPPPVQMAGTDVSANLMGQISSMTSEEAVRSGVYSGETRARVHAALKGMGITPGNAPTLGTNPRFLPQQPAVVHGQLPFGVQQPMTYQQGPAVNPHYQNPSPPRPAPVPQTQPVYQSTQQPYSYQVGDIVNGHQWNGAQWVPVAMAPPPPPPPPAYAPPPPPPAYYPGQATNVVQPGPMGQPPPPQNSDLARAQEAVMRTHQGVNPVLGANPGALDALNDAQAYGRATGRNPQAEYQSRFQPSPPIPSDGQVN